MEDLRKLYTKETGSPAIFRKGSSDYHTLGYVQWLEIKVEKFDSAAKKPEQQTKGFMPTSCLECAAKNWCPNEYGGMTCEEFGRAGARQPIC